MVQKPSKSNNISSIRVFAGKPRPVTDSPFVYYNSVYIYISFCLPMLPYPLGVATIQTSDFFRTKSDDDAIEIGRYPTRTAASAPTFGWFCRPSLPGISHCLNTSIRSHTFLYTHDRLNEPMCTSCKSKNLGQLLAINYYMFIAIHMYLLDRADNYWTFVTMRLRCEQHTLGFN